MEQGTRYGIGAGRGMLCGLRRGAACMEGVTREIKEPEERKMPKCSKVRAVGEAELDICICREYVHEGRWPFVRSIIDWVVRWVVDQACQVGLPQRGGVGFVEADVARRVASRAHPSPPVVQGGRGEE